MSAPTILQIMQGLEARLATISGLRTTEFIKDQMTPPFAMVGVPEVTDYHQTYNSGYLTLSPRIYVFTSAAVDRIGQAALAGYANPTGSTSVKAAVEAGPTLGGIVSQCVVKSFRPLGVEEIGVMGYYGGVWETTVIAEGK